MYRFFNPTFAPFNKKFTKTAYFFLFSIDFLIKLYYNINKIKK